MGRIPFSSSQSSPPEARSSQRGLEYQHPRDPLKSSHGGERGVFIPRRAHLAFFCCLSFCGNSGRGLRTRGTMGPTTLPLASEETQTHVYTTSAPSNRWKGELIQQNPLPLLLRQKRRTLLTTKRDGEQGREILTVLVYFCQFLTLMDASRTPIFSSFFCRIHWRQRILFMEDSKDTGPETTNYVRSPEGQESRAF